MNNISLVSELTKDFMFIILAAAFAILPFVGRKSLAFGVSIPKAEYNSESVKKARHVFLVWILGIGAVALFGARLGGDILTESVAVDLFTGLISAQVIAYGAVYYILFRKMKRIKAEAGWEQDAQEIMVADTHFFETHKTICSPRWFWLHAVVIGITAALGVFFYDRVPNIVPLQMNMAGEIVKTAPKSVVSVFFSVLMQILMLGVSLCTIHSDARRL